jgi:hypothetical protein
VKIMSRKLATASLSLAVAGAAIATATLSPAAHAGEFKPIPIVDFETSPVDGGLLDVKVTFMVSCARKFVGFETRIVNNTTPPHNPHAPAPTLPPLRTVWFRVIADVKDAKCSLPDRPKTATFQVANAGAQLQVREAPHGAEDNM